MLCYCCCFFSTQDVLSDQQLAAYLQVVEQGKAASAMPYQGGHTYHHPGYATVHPQQAYYARQYHHKNTF